LPDKSLWIAFAHTDSNSQRDGNADRYGYGHGKCIGEPYSYGTTVTKDYTNSAPAPDSSASAVSVGADNAAFFGNSRSNSRVPESCFPQSTSSQNIKLECVVPNAFTRRRWIARACSIGRKLRAIILR
jgi:hypothetical protein